ncbi:AtpZ/AtpI family protein [Candidatus Peribacteria bacterium]|nr:AtpZ/AtpI family protein [Candidatus Peribacteria bacterium]
MPNCLMTKIEDMLQNRFQRWIRTLMINISVIALFCSVGYILDMYFGTDPWILIAFLVISFPVSLAIQIRQIKKIQH